jgi:trans-aconitate methyltransferase
MNREKIDRFWASRTKVEDPRKATHFKDDDMHIFDLELIQRYAGPESEVLDLACGTGCHTNLLAPQVKSIKAVDKFGKFLESVADNTNVTTEQCDVLHYEDEKRYDLILVLGLMNYFSDSEAFKIYGMCKKLLKPEGTLIVKHACGVEDDVLVDTYSEQLKENYYALYRHVKKEQNLLSEHFQIETVDIYPERLNPWRNTHFYAFVCTRDQ